MADVFNMADKLQNRPTRISELFDWQKSVLGRIAEVSPGNADQLKYMGHVPIYMLPFKEQVKAMADYRRISGLDEIFNTLGGGSKVAREKQISNIMESMNVIKAGEYMRFPVSGTDPVDQLFAGMSINYTDKVRPAISGLNFPDASASAGSHFGPGVSSLPMMHESRFNMPGKMKAGASFTTFDIETASLMRNQIHEVAYRSGIVGADGAMSMTAADPIRFRPKALARGSMGVGGVPLQLEEFINKRHNMAYSGLKTSGLGDDYAERMKPFLNQILSSDHLIGHNILGFDIPQVFSALAGTKKFQTDAAFRELVDTAHTKAIGSSIDTLMLARSAPNLAGIKLDDSLLRKGSGSQFSIENLLLQTNLGSKLSAEELTMLREKGLHLGEVDDRITMSLYRHLADLTTDGSGLPDDVRESIRRSGALTPVTKITRQGDIADSALKTLISINGGIQDSEGELSKLLTSAQAGNTADADLAFNMIRKNNIQGLRFNINPIEHEILSTRRLGLGIGVSSDIDVDKLVYGNNLFDKETGFGRKGDYSTGVIGRNRITDAEMGSIQNKLADRGMPWAGASFEERSFGTSLAHLTSSVNPNNAVISSLNSDLMMSTFEQFNPNRVQYATYSGRVSMPAGLLADAGLLGQDDGHLLRLSTVEPTVAAPDPRINLVYDFKGKQEEFATYLEDLTKQTDDVISEKLGGGGVARFRAAMDEDNLATLIRESGDTGIAIGQLQPEQARSVHRLLQRTHGQERMSDIKTMQNVRLPFAGQTAENVSTTGALWANHLTDADMASIPLDVQRARHVNTAGYKELVSDKNAFRLNIAQFDAAFGNDATTPIAKRVYEGYQNIRGHIPKAVGLIAAAAVGMHFYNKRQDNKQYQETLDTMPLETGSRRYMSADLLQQNKDMGIDKSYQRYDPLATAFVMDNLNSSRINHTNMSNSKNNLLYGGVL